MAKIAINGFGRIGRGVFRRLLDSRASLTVTAVNDLADVETLAHLLKYDSLYGLYKRKVKPDKGEFLIDNDKRVKVLNIKEPAKLPWKKLGVDIVLECSGVFTDKRGAAGHLKAGAKKVIISAPSKSEDIPTYLLGVNQENYQPAKDIIVSMGSCTTNCLAPVAKVLDEEFGVLRGFMTTVHSYTSDQPLLDAPHKDLRRARAAALSIVPTTTGAAKTVEKCLFNLKDKLDGIALRVPTPVVSIVDFVCQVAKETEPEEVNYVFKKASNKKDLCGILGIEDSPLVSADYKANCYSAIIDAPSTMTSGNMVKVLAWYDNEWGYCCRLAEFAEYVAQKI